MQTFDARTALVVKLVLLALLLTLPAWVAFGVWRENDWQRIGEPVAQPIPFSHKHHVGDDGIDCRYCHTQVETGRSAGLPSAGICMSCHSQLYTDQAVLAPLRASIASGQPIAWRRVHVLPDFAYFNHAPHVAKGVACVVCHGRVDQMPLAWRAHKLQMQWCMDCHRNPAPRLRPPARVFEMDDAALAPADAATLAQALRVEPRRRLTDCSTCHR